MMALIRKDLPWVWPLFVACVVVAFLVTMSVDAERVWLAVDTRHFGELQHVLWIPAVLVGVLLALRDPVGRTEDLLAHRSVTPERVFLARVVTGLAFVLLLGVVPFLVDLVRLGASGLIGLDVVDWSRAGVLATLTLFAAACFAVAFFALTLPVAWFARQVALVCVWFPVAMLHTSLAGSRTIDGGKPILPHALAMLGVTALLLVLARWTATARFDADRPVPRRALPGILIGTGAGAALLAAFVASMSQSWGIESLGRTRPFAIVRDDGSITLARWADRRHRRLELLDGEQAVTDVTTRDDSMQRDVRAPRVWVEQYLEFEVRFDSGRQVEQVLMKGPEYAIWTVVVGRDTGRVHALRQPFGEGEMSVQEDVERPDGGHFSPNAALFEAGRDDGEALFVADPGDDTVWRVELPETGARMTLEPVPMPEGDRVEGIEWVRSGDDLQTERGLVGTAGVYSWDGSDWQRAVRAFPPSPREAEETDALTPLLVVQGTDVRETLRQRVTLSSFGDRFFAVAAAAPAVLRPAPLALATVIAPDRSTRRDWVRDPVVADRPWLLFLPLIGTAWALLGVRRRLRALGTDAARRRPWLVATALGGPAIYFLLRAVETARAHRRMEPTPAPPPRVRSARQATPV